MKLIKNIFLKLTCSLAWQTLQKKSGQAIVVVLFVFAFFALCFSLRSSIKAQRVGLLSSDKVVEADYHAAAFQDNQQTQILESPAAKNQQGRFVAADTSHSLGFDNSEITTSYDAFGSKTEMRSFQDNRRIFMVVVETAPDGTKSARASSRSGEVSQLTADLVDRALYASGNQLADALGFIEPVKPLETIVPPETVLSDAVEPQTSPTVLENNTASTDKRDEQRLNPAPLATESAKTVEINTVLPRSVKPELQQINIKD